MFCALQPENHQWFRLGPLFQALESKHMGAGGMSNYVTMSYCPIWKWLIVIICFIVFYFV